YRHLLALASLEHFALPCDYIRFDEVFAEEPAKPILSTVLTREIEKKPFNSGSSVVKVTESYRGIELWDEPGIGCEPNREIIDKYTLEKFVWE
ncbi:MAG: hypothetical protein IKW74_02070, partial [Thermoguttaceae bacterium]|nr:hypothetical protein [Thermoguttaceae bacterium]